MSYRISIVSENHGYTIRLEKTTYALEGPNKDESVERARTIATLAIIGGHTVALEAFDVLNNFLTALVKHKILKEDVFRCRQK